MLASVLHVNVAVCTDDVIVVAAVVFIVPVPLFAFNVIVLVFAVHLAYNVTDASVLFHVLALAPAFV